MKKLLIIALLVVGCDYAPTEHTHIRDVEWLMVADNTLEHTKTTTKKYNNSRFNPSDVDYPDGYQFQFSFYDCSHSHDIYYSGDTSGVIEYETADSAPPPWETFSNGDGRAFLHTFQTFEGDSYINHLYSNSAYKILHYKELKYFEIHLKDGDNTEYIYETAFMVDYKYKP